MWSLGGALVLQSENTGDSAADDTREKLHSVVCVECGDFKETTATVNNSGLQGAADWQLQLLPACQQGAAE